MGASGVNWNNVPHETILTQINGGAGAGPVSDAAASYRRIAAALRVADQDLRDALGASGASWEGRAANEMQTASTPLATWADEADQLAVSTSSATDVFGDQFATTRAAMPAVVDVPSGSWVDDTGLSAIPGVTTDRERAEAAADAAQQEAARRMEAYDNASYDTVRTQYFSQPPTVTLEVPPPAAPGGPGVGGTSGAVVGGPSAAGAYATAGGWTAPSGPAAPVVPGRWVPPGTTAPGAPTPPSGAAAPAPTAPAASGGYQPGGGTGPGGGGLPPGYGPGAGGAYPGDYPATGSRPGGRPGSSSRGGAGGQSGGAPLPAVPGVPGSGYGAGGRFGPGGYGPSGGPSGFGPGASGVPGGSHGPGGLAGFGDEAPGQRGGMSGFGPGMADPGDRAARAGTGYGPMGAAGARGEEDAEHRRPDYLVETEDVWGDGTRVAPPVIGERTV